MRLSWAPISTVPISTQCDLRFLSYSLGQFSEVSLQRCFRSQNWDIYSTKKSKQTICLNRQRIREFNYDFYFMTLNDLDHVTLKSCFLLSRVTPGTAPISDFYPSKYFPMICLSKQKIKRCVFPLIFVFGVDTRACFVFIPRGRENWWIFWFRLMPEGPFLVYTLTSLKVKRLTGKH